MFVIRPWALILGIAVVGAVAILLLFPGEPGEPTISTASERFAQPAEEAPPEAQAPAVSPPAAAAPTTETAPTVSPAIDGVIVDGEYPHMTDAAGFRVYWRNDAARLHVGLVSPGTGYVAIGFDPENRMEGANFILGAVSGGRTVARDDYGTGPMAHEADTVVGGQDHILEASGREANGQTVFEFVIPLDSRDGADKRLVPGHTYTILVAYHSANDSFSAKHSRYGRGEIRLDLN